MHSKIMAVTISGVAFWLTVAIVGAEELSHRTTKESSPFIYESVTDKEQTIGKLNIDPKTGKVSIDETPMYESTKHTFVGGIQVFVRGVGSDNLPTIISAAHPEYNLSSKTNPLLSTVGVVHLNEKGFVEGQNAKSGWVDNIAYGKYTNTLTGKSERIGLEGVTFWVNKGGKQWWNFKVKRALIGPNFTEEIKIKADLEQITTGVNRPVIIVLGKYKLIPNIVSLGKISFAEKIDNTKVKTIQE